MNTRICMFCGLLILVVLVTSCNPDCNSSSSGNISIDSSPAVLEGRPNEILLRSIPANFLQNRQVYIDDIQAVPRKLMAVESSFENELEGLIVQIPEEISVVSTPNIYVDDPDCSSNVLLVDPLQIRSQDFFFSSDAFVVPPMPIIIIPIPAVAPPVSVTNAWITPYDRTYCIWFVPEKDEDGNELVQLTEFDLEKDDPADNQNAGSREFVVCGTQEAHNNANINPVSGVIDKKANFIHIQIDRTAKGLDVETFTGSFIQPTSIPDTEEWRNGGGCAPNLDRKIDFMLLTSQRSGQQLMMVKALEDL